jgi:hypothetical protein
MNDSEESASVTVRDKRVDYIGDINSLGKLLGDDLKTAVKVSMAEKGARIAEGDHYQGLLVEGEAGTVDARKFYKRFLGGGMSEKEFLGAINVSKTEAGKLMSKKELDAITDYAPVAPKLVVTKKKTYSPTLLDAIKGVSEAAQ